MALYDRLKGRFRRLLDSLPGAKERGELAYWAQKREKEGTLKNDHYRFLFTEHWGLEESFYNGKRVLDIGCGPRGSLEWAHGAKERIGLDSLVNEYRRLGIDDHEMSYVDSGIESTPFKSGYFDVVASINSLDHVENVDRAIDEIKRITRPGGVFLLLVEVNHEPTVCEPHSLNWSIIDRFKPEFEPTLVRHYETSESDMRSAITGPEYDHSIPGNRHGMLSAMLTRK